MRRLSEFGFSLRRQFSLPGAVKGLGNKITATLASFSVLSINNDKWKPKRIELRYYWKFNRVKKAGKAQHSLFKLAGFNQVNF